MDEEEREERGSKGKRREKKGKIMESRKIAMTHSH